MNVNLFIFFSIKKQIIGKIKKPKGKKKYGGNNSEVKNPRKKNIAIFNYFFLFRGFQFFYYLT